MSFVAVLRTEVKYDVESIVFVQGGPARQAPSKLPMTYVSNASNDGAGSATGEDSSKGAIMIFLHTWSTLLRRQPMGYFWSRNASKVQLRRLKRVHSLEHL